MLKFVVYLPMNHERVMTRNLGALMFLVNNMRLLSHILELQKYLSINS